MQENVKVRILEDDSSSLVPLMLAAGQTRPVRLYVEASNVSNPVITVKVTYTIDGTPETSFTSIICHALTKRDMHAPHKLTFLHPSRIVSYAILRAPSKDVIRTVEPRRTLPVLLNLHGAGLEADSDQVRHMLDPVPDLRAFVLFPTGVTPWSGDDWHDWGFADAEAAIASISDWILAVKWNGPSADCDKWLVSGHSNGGQGTLYALTHHPDRIIAAAPVSGYLSIQKYVPYQAWHEAESRVTHVVQSSLQSFRHELMVENFAGIPVLNQHGGGDDNVPVFHSRRLHQLTSGNGKADTSRYVELPGKGHWYEGVMTTPRLTDFYNECLVGEANKPVLPQDFQFVVSNPADFSSRGGLFVDQLVTPDQLGKVRVRWNAASASVNCETSNIQCFHFAVDSILTKGLTELVVDGQTLLKVNKRTTETWEGKTPLFLLLINRSWVLRKVRVLAST